MPPDSPPHETWSRLLLARLKELDAGLPRDLHGIIQFEIVRTTSSKRSAYFYWVLRRRGSASVKGVSSYYDTWVVAREEALVQILDGTSSGSGIFQASGRVELFRSVLRWTASRPNPVSPLELRAAR